MYLASDGAAHPTPGGLQIVFADLGTPTGDGFSAYHALRDKLADRGLAREAVRFIHEAKTDRDKADLFAACRDGRVSVLIGSTEKMGVGTNVQARAVALHHLDCPWRPADLQQREGRILRQGNQNPEVRILRYVTEGSFDGYSWQTVTRKAAFIAQVMRGRLDVREIEDIGDNALSYNEVKALAAGNPLLIDHAQAQAELTRLERLERAHRHGQDSLRYTIRTTTRSLESLRQRLAATEAAITRRVDTRGDAFAMTVNNIAHTARTEAGQALRGVLQRLLADPRLPSGTRRVIAAVGGFDVAATVYRDHERRPSLTVELVDAPGSVLTLTPVELAQADIVIRLENRLHDLDTIAANTVADIGRARGRHRPRHHPARRAVPPHRRPRRGPGPLRRAGRRAHSRSRTPTPTTGGPGSWAGGAGLGAGGGGSHRHRTRPGRLVRKPGRGLARAAHRVGPALHRHHGRRHRLRPPGAGRRPGR